MLGYVIVRIYSLVLLLIAAAVALGAVQATDLGPPRFHPTFARSVRFERSC